MSRDVEPAMAPDERTLRHFVGDAVWSALVDRAYERSHPPGTTLLRQDEPGTHVLAVLSGVVKVVRRERSGDLTLLAFRGPGELLGEVAVLDGQVRSASVHALSPCVVGVVAKPEFLGFATERELFPVLVRYALAKLRESDRARGGGDVTTRLAATLATLADLGRAAGRPHTGPLELALTRNELAQHLKLSRNTVSSALAALGPVGVRPARGRIHLDDPAALRRTAASGA
jgi:CRP/FNR family transcriptional regulator, cyclic AMP receptor protein